MEKKEDLFTTSGFLIGQSCYCGMSGIFENKRYTHIDLFLSAILLNFLQTKVRLFNKLNICGLFTLKVILYRRKRGGPEIGMLMTNGEKRGTITRWSPDGMRVKNHRSVTI